jgi:hypothetical protein
VSANTCCISVEPVGGFSVIGSNAHGFLRIGAIPGRLFEGELLSGEVVSGKRLATCIHRFLHQTRCSTLAENDGRRTGS